MTTLISLRRSFPAPTLNFQRVPTVDTSNPFAAKGIPSLDESFVVIHFRNLEGIDFPWLLAMLQGSLFPISIRSWCRAAKWGWRWS
ncbi:phosphoribulokinase [Citrobacter koseri]|uniref:Phosphoribulokinase n=1 Tax=Citrobacter koseri TaxID=545 RepID=A0A2X2WC57_CITKO|nr:phosphoribulokinase [Citrobacter koseri]